MILKNLKLTSFRNHAKQEFVFDKTTIIIGRNTSGKTSILEAIYVLSHGTSFRAVHDRDLIQEKKDFARIDAEVKDAEDTTHLRVIMAEQNAYLSKKYLVDGATRRLSDFAEYMVSALFTPQDIEIITGSPGLRRRYIDSILTKSHKEYRVALARYEKALRQRNRMLHDMKNGRKEYKRVDFEYWEKLLIEYGTVIHAHRRQFVEYVNGAQKDVFSFQMGYDHSIISTERLFKYHFEELGAGVTLVGPQRDDYQFFFPETKKEVREFGSRGEQRLTILQLKLLEIAYLKSKTGTNPVLLLDDIFSELDSENINKIYHFIEDQQTVITTTHREFVPKDILKQKAVVIIEL